MNNPELTWLASILFENVCKEFSSCQREEMLETIKLIIKLKKIGESVFM